MGRADPCRAAPGAGRLPAGLHRRGAGQLVPRPGHRAVQRRGHRRRAQRHRQLPGLPAEPAPVDDADHRLRRPAAGRPGPAGLARIGQVDAAQLDRPVATAPPSASPIASRETLPGNGSARSRCTPHVRTRCSGPPTWCWPRSTRWSTRSPRRAGRRAPTHGGPAARPPRPRRSPATGWPPRASRIWTVRRDKEKTGVFTGAFAVNPVNGSATPGVYRRLRADGLRHRRDHGGARPGHPGLGVRHRVRPADRPHRAAVRGPSAGRGLHR